MGEGGDQLIDAFALKSFGVGLMEDALKDRISVAFRPPLSELVDEGLPTFKQFVDEVVLHPEDIAQLLCDSAVSFFDVFCQPLQLNN